MKKWKIGDVVQLASGGPRMTVTDDGAARYGPEVAICTWFLPDQSGVKTQEFPEAALIKAANPHP